MSCCTSLSRCILAIINSVFMLASIVLVGIGSWIFIENSHYRSLTSGMSSSMLPACIILTVGVLLLLLSFVGCFAACKEQKCLNGLYFTLLLILFVGLAGGIATAYFFRGRIDSELHTALKKELNNYLGDDLSRKEIDFIQHQFKCCGVDNYTDWKETAWGKNQTKPYPESCCVHENCTYVPELNNTNNSLYKEGCYSGLKIEFTKHLDIVGYVALGVTVVLIIGMIFSCVLLCRRQSEIPYIGLANPDGMRV